MRGWKRWMVLLGAGAALVAGAAVAVMLTRSASESGTQPAPVPAAAAAARATAATATAAGSATRVLRVCADPNNMPLSSRRRDGLENRLVAILAEELGAEVAYHWWPQRRGHVRKTLEAGLCDVIPGIASEVDMVLTTRPYYRSSYVFASRSDAGPPVESWDDARLRKRRVGVMLVGDDYANSPPAHALSARGAVNNLVAFRVYADYREESPLSRMLEALEDGRIDVAIPWGPVAGWHAVRRPGLLALHPAPAAPGAPPMAFDISIGVRHGEEALRDELDRALARRRADVDRLLDEFGVPRVPPPAAEGPR